MPDEKHSTTNRDYEYKRFGTLSLLAAIDLKSGEAIPLVRDKHSSTEYIEFLKLLDDKYQNVYIRNLYWWSNVFRPALNHLMLLQ